MKKAATLLSLSAFWIFLGIITGTHAFAEGIKVGILLPLTGNLAHFGDIERKSFLMAANEINKAGGIHGEPILLIIEDTGGEPAKGKSAIDKLILKHGVCIVGGGISSSVTWAASRLAQKKKVPFLINTASADKITEKGGDYIFRLNAPIGEYHTALNSFLTDVAHVKTVAILFENTLFGQSQSREFVERCKGLGLQVVIKEGYEVGTIEDEQIEKINSRRPDLFYMISSSIGTDASLMVRKARGLNFNAKLFVGGGAGFTLLKFQENAGSASEYVFAATLWTPSVQYPGASDYFNKFVAKYNEPTEYHGAQAYASMYVIADALKRAQSHTPHDVRDALTETDIMTVFGPVKFISYGKKKFQNKIPTFLGQWLDGKFEAVWPKNVSKVKYVYPDPMGNERNENYLSTN